MKKAEPTDRALRGGEVAAQARAMLDVLLQKPAGGWFDITDDLSLINSTQAAYTTIYSEAGKRIVEVASRGGSLYARNLVDRTP